MLCPAISDKPTAQIETIIMHYLICHNFLQTIHVWWTQWTPCPIVALLFIMLYVIKNIVIRGKSLFCILCRPIRTCKFCDSEMNNGTVLSTLNSITVLIRRRQSLYSRRVVRTLGYDLRNETFRIPEETRFENVALPRLIYGYANCRRQTIQ